MQSRMSPIGGMPSSRRSLPDEPPSSATVTTAVRDLAGNLEIRDSANADNKVIISAASASNIESIVDANINLHIDTPKGKVATPIVEIKNMNSFRNVQRAIDHEIKRQIDLLESGQPVQVETRSYDAVKDVTFSLRSKESANDYRYFPEPDLPPLEIPGDWLESIRGSVPEMPWARAARFQSEFGLTGEHADQLTASREIADYYEDLVSSGTEPSEDDIVAHCRRELAAYKVPKQVRFLEALPKSTVGKILRRDLRTLA